MICVYICMCIYIYIYIYIYILYIILYYIMLCNVMLCYIILYYVVVYCIILYVYNNNYYYYYIYIYIERERGREISSEGWLCTPVFEHTFLLESLGSARIFPKPTPRRRADECRPPQAERHLVCQHVPIHSCATHPCLHSHSILLHSIAFHSQVVRSRLALSLNVLIATRSEEPGPSREGLRRRERAADPRAAAGRRLRATSLPEAAGAPLGGMLLLLLLLLLLLCTETSGDSRRGEANRGTRGGAFELRQPRRPFRSSHPGVWSGGEKSPESQPRPRTI